MSEQKKPLSYQLFEENDDLKFLLSPDKRSEKRITEKLLKGIQKKVRDRIQNVRDLTLLTLADKYLNFGELEKTQGLSYEQNEVEKSSRGALRQQIKRVFQDASVPDSLTEGYRRLICIILIYIGKKIEGGFEDYDLTSPDQISSLEDDLYEFHAYHKSLKVVLKRSEPKFTIQRKWLMYIRTPSGVYRTYLDIKPDNKASYMSKYDTILSGPIKYECDQVMVTLRSPELPAYFLSLRAYVTEGMLKKQSVLVSGLAIANGTDKNTNFALPFILFSHSEIDATEVKSFQMAKSSADYALIRNKNPYFSPVDRAEKDIIKFLALETYISSTYFTPGIKSISRSFLAPKIESLGRASFSDDFGKVLTGNNWISVARKGSRTSSSMIVYYWSFIRDEIKQSIKVKVYKTTERAADTFYKGEVRIYNSEYWIHLSQGMNQKFLFGRVSEDDPNCILLIGSYDEDHKRYATREILMPEEYISDLTNEAKEENEDAKSTVFTYKTFSVLESPKDFVKMYLNYKNHGRLSYPSSLDSHSRYGQERGAMPYQGKYFLYVKGVYPENKGKILRFTLEIDRLARAELNKKFEYGKGTLFHYVGMAEQLNSTLYLHLSNQNESKRQASRIMFHVSDGGAAASVKRNSTLVGILLDTDKASFPIANTCIAVKVEDTEESTFMPSEGIDEAEEKLIWKELKELNEAKYNTVFDPKVTSLSGFFEITTDRNGSILLRNQYDDDTEGV